MRTDVFARAAATPTVTRPPTREARTGAFANNETPPPPTTLARADAQVGGFELASATRPPPSDRPRGVATASFDEAPAVRQRATAEPRAVSATGFGEVASGDAPVPRNGGPATVRQGQFGDGVAEAPAPRKRERPAANPDTPVEILSKPRPVYTDEARRLGIEGEVVLEVTFVASGELRVHRVLDSLGHGLDEAAVEAARKISFTPARRAGRPVDHTVKLRIVFRLA